MFSRQMGWPFARGTSREGPFRRAAAQSLPSCTDMGDPTEPAAGETSYLAAGGGVIKAEAVYAISALAVALLLLAGCDSAGSVPTPGPGSLQVRGHVVEVVGRSITEVETLRIRDADGKTWTFTTEGFTGFSPAHLREHQLFGQTVLVTYVAKEGRLVAVNTAD